MKSCLSVPNGRLHYPATERNRDPILNVLIRILPKSGTILEIASGSGQHITYFAKQFKNLRWQPSDANSSVFPSINAWAETYDVKNSIYPPLKIDTRVQNWPIEKFGDLGAILAINLIHIASWESCVGLFVNAGIFLRPGGILYLYGPYKIKNKHTAQSNEEFNRSLQLQNREWGIRNLDDVAKLGKKNRFELSETVQMPANNLSVIFKKLNK